MPPRSTWKGYLRVSLVSVPVKAYTASASSGGIRLNQLCQKCHSRVKYKKECPEHGELKTGEIVSGYEFAKDQYVVIDTDELEKVRTESDKAISVQAFVDEQTIDPIYHTGKTMYLLPDGAVGQKPYSLMHRVMTEEQLHGFGQVVMSGKEQIVLIRPIDDLLAMTILSYSTQVKSPASFSDDVSHADVANDEVELTKQLIGALRDEDFDLAERKDLYTERLTELIEAKVEGREVVALPAEDVPVINLMDALKQSVANLGQSAPAAAKAPAKKKAAKPKRKMAQSKKKKAPAKKKKRTG